MNKDTVNPSSLNQSFRSDGVVHIAGALSTATLKLAENAFNWNLSHPGPGAAELPANGSGTFYQDLANPASFAAYAELLDAAEIGRAIRSVWGKPDVWFMYEQVFRKSGGATRRTPWHQDTPYLPIEGDDLAVMWISFDPVTAEKSLEFVRGSHRGTLYDGSRFDPEDDTAPLYGDGSMPQLPDIEADRSRWPIVSYAIEPGDVVIFHPAILHGGAGTDAARERRTLSLRFFGEDAVVAHRPGGPVETQDSTIRTESTQDTKTASGKMKVHPLTTMRSKPAGSPFRDNLFPKLRQISE